MKLMVIGNPIAGGGKAGPKMVTLEQLLRQRGHDVEVLGTKARLDAQKWAGDLPEDLDRLIVAGGDGTLNEVLNGLSDVARVPIVQMPAGTANVLVRELGLPWQPQGVVDLVEAGKVRHLDMGVMRVTQASSDDDGGDDGGEEATTKEQRFLVILSSGFDAMVIEDIHHHRKGKLGMRGYFMPLLRTLVRHKGVKLSVTLDESEMHDAAMVVVANSQNYAGLFRLADKATMDSGVFDVVMLPKVSIAALVRLGWAARRGKVSSMKGVKYVSAKQIRIDSELPVAVEADGEYVGKTPVEIWIKAGAVPMVVPA